MSALGPSGVAVDRVVVGAGVAGLAAAAALRARGLGCAVFEAAPRIGGRTWTTCPAALGGVPFDHGASWLHDADRNPLVPLAPAGGLVDAAEVWVSRTFIAGRPAGAAELAEYDRAHDRIVAAAAARAAALPDTSLAEAIAAVARDDPAAARWQATVAAWEGAIIAGADAADLSLLDWRNNALKGRNLAVGGGLGALVASLLGPRAGPVHLGTPVRRIRWQEPGGRLAVETPRGTITAKGCIVTVSTGVLAAGHIGFAPALPEAVQEAIAGLPMGLLTKVALRAKGTDRLGLPPFSGVDRLLAGPDDPAMVFHAWPFGRDHLIGFTGGRAAWELARAGAAAAEDFARQQLRALFGARADAAFGAGAVVTEWGTDPTALGAYCYARPGAAAARAVLAQPLADGRLAFAGEACCTDGLAGTVGGAYLSGVRAAAAMID
jgi:monoamine oxidase